MAGIYIHIPFCRKACHYCNFHFSTQLKHIDAFTDSLIKEIEIQKGYLNEPINTLYFGGGTPSLLPIESLNKIVQQLYKHFNLTDQMEFTLEANPDDIHLQQVKQWKALGVNRLSIGIQSFQNEALDWMNRAHKVNQSLEAIEAAQTAAIKNISVDLIYGTPHLKDKDLLADLELIKKLQIPHVSCYALTVEDKTALHKMIKMGKMENVNTQDQARHFDIISTYLQQLGMEHYEISNFAMPGYRSKHNSSYWQGIPYLGLGPSAHSYNGHSRQWNISNNALYIQSLDMGHLSFEMETLNTATKYNEYMMTSLRCMEGFSLEYIQLNFGDKFLQHTLDIATNFLHKEQLTKTETGYTITPKARFLADGIASDFFWIA
jgi:oxygen-independent coproporphyrinogen-3 oxidase